MKPPGPSRITVRGSLFVKVRPEFNWREYLVAVGFPQGNPLLILRPHFQTVRMQATVRTEESEERLAQVVEETERRCPVFNLLEDAGVNLEVVWVRQPIS